MVAEKERMLEVECSKRRRRLGGSVRRRNGRSDRRHHRTPAFIDQLPGTWRAPPGRPLELRRSWSRAQPQRHTCHGPDKRVWAPDASPASTDFGVPIVGPGATVGTVETREIGRAHV